MTSSKLEIGQMGVVKVEKMRKTWSNPLPLELIVTADSGSFRDFDPDRVTGLPIGGHPGAFGVQRKHHFHEGVDIYAPEGTVVRAVEDGKRVLLRSRKYRSLDNVHTVWREVRNPN